MNTLRVVIFGAVIGIIIALGSVAAYFKLFRKTEKPQQPVQIVANSKEQRRIDSLIFAIQSLNVKIDSSYKVINTKKVVIEVQKKKISDIKNYADSLQSVYLANKTIPGCDSVLHAKDSLIKEKNIVIKQLDDQNKDYSRQVFLLSSKNELQNIMITSKDSTINKLECAYNWKIKHKFLAWFLGWKCN